MGALGKDGLGSDRLRVLLLVNTLEIGGSESQLTELVARTHPERMDAVVATLAASRRPRHEDRMRGLGVPVVALTRSGGAAPGRALAAAARLNRLLGHRRPHVLYAWGNRMALLALPVARRHGVPVVLARRAAGHSETETSSPLLWLLGAAERRVCLVTANSAAVRDSAISRGVSPSRVRMVPNGCALTARASTPSNGEVRIGYMARLRPGKGHGRLMDVLGRMDTQTPWRVDLAGDGPLEAEVCAAVGRLGLESRVRWLGVVDDVAGFWAEHDVGVLLSDTEGSPNAVIEAATAGRPVVVTDVPGSAETVAPGTGFVIPKDDPAAIAEAVARLVDDPALRTRMGAAARRSVRDRFDMDAMVDGHLAALAEAAQVGA